MFYFSINEGALDTIKKEAKGSDREIIGVLIGRVYDNLLVVTKAVSGNQASGLTRVKLDNSTMAKIVNEIMAGKLEGNILGWYHSHPGFGIFMSSTDIGTQQALQQFSPKVAALVIDPKEDNYGVFTLDPNLGVLQIPDEQIFMYKDGEDGIPEVLKDIHSFSVKMEIGPEAAVDRIRYIIECTKAYWPDKKCLICGSDLKLDEKLNRWICPSMEKLEKTDEKEKGVEDSAVRKVKAKAKPRKFKKVQHVCKICNIELKHSTKLNAWYCKDCRRVYKHRLKAKDEKAAAEELSAKDESKMPLEIEKASELEEAEQVGTEPSAASDVIVEAVEPEIVHEEPELQDSRKSEDVGLSEDVQGDEEKAVKEPSETIAEPLEPTPDVKSDIEKDKTKKKAAPKKAKPRRTKKVRKKSVKRTRKGTGSNK
jgi:proteasome lid subunit RPN8/RPN11/predicted RNA-binding Zn-ribbon protein involved in translation (DUF1610 family)